MTDAEKVKALTGALQTAIQYVGAAIAEGYLKDNVIPGPQMLPRLQQILDEVKAA